MFTADTLTIKHWPITTTMSAPTYGLISRFENVQDVYAAASVIRDAGYTSWDVISPFPIHGIDSAMGVRRSKVPRFSLVGGITGFCTGMSMIWFMNEFDYPLVVGGKPFFSPMFAFPVSYELTILFTAFATIFGMFFLNRLPMHYHPVMKHSKFLRGTDDEFFIVIESNDPKFNLSTTQDLLARVGGKEITPLED